MIASSRPMRFSDICQRKLEINPWEEGERIPWDDPEFSKRVLTEHLSQTTTAASKQKKTIQKECAWIFSTLMKHQPGRILDLGCGPGLYTEILAAKRNQCVGIDFAPAAIAYAKKHASHNCEYLQGDIRKIDFGTGYDVILYNFGAINLLPEADAKAILEKAFHSLKPGGFVLIESSSVEAVDQIGNQPSMWYSADESIFSATPHLCLMECFWDEPSNTATERYYIIDGASGEVTSHCASTKAYTEDEIATALNQAGFGEVEFYPSMTGEVPEYSQDFLVVVGIK